MKRRDLLNLLLSQAIVLTSLRVKKAWATDWSYRGATGSDFWGELDPKFETCVVGQAQSPIDLDGVYSGFGDLVLDYRDTPLKITNNDRTIRIDPQPGSSLILDGQKYDLLQFHFHHPSEHLISGLAFEMEAHFVHQSQATEDLVVLAVLMSEGDINRALAEIWQRIPPSNRQTEVSDLIINACDLLPQNIDRYYRYSGSLTTPPCSENVTWLVLKQPVEISKSQRDRFLQVIGTNARPVQPLNQRRLLRSN